MPVGPKGVFEANDWDRGTVGRIVEHIDEELHHLKYWDGESPAQVEFLMMSFPNLAVQTEVRKQYTEGEDTWSSVTFEHTFLGWEVVLTP